MGNYFFLIWFTAAILVPVILYGIPSLIEWHRRRRESDQIAPLVEIVAAAIREHPSQWARDAHSMSHSGLGASVWIANGKGSLKLNTKSDWRAYNGAPIVGTAADVLWEAVEEHARWVNLKTAEDFVARAKTVFGGR